MRLQRLLRRDLRRVDLMPSAREIAIVSVLADLFAEMVGDPRPPSRADANYAMVALCGNRMIAYERAWALPQTMMDRTGFQCPVEMCSHLSTGELEAVIRQPPCGHRLPGRIAAAMSGTARVIASEYLGDARNLYQSHDVATVLRRLEALPGYGRKLSRLALRIILLDWAGDVAGDRAELDLSPDLHVCRVLFRLGLIERPDPLLAIEAARRVSPNAPYLVDGAFSLGTTVCGARPKCEACGLLAHCHHNR